MAVLIANVTYLGKLHNTTHFHSYILLLKLLFFSVQGVLK